MPDGHERRDHRSGAQRTTTCRREDFDFLTAILTGRP